jgi:hypothetical protein
MALAAIAAVGAAGPASAQGYTPSNIVVVPVDGNTVNVNGSGFLPGSLITVTIQSDPIVLGTINANASGSFSKDFQIPCVEDGLHTITASGTGANGLPASSSLQITIKNCVIATDAKLAFTGSNDTVPFVGAGIGLVLAGAVLVVIAYRRRSAHSLTV